MPARSVLGALAGLALAVAAVTAAAAAECDFDLVPAFRPGDKDYPPQITLGGQKTPLAERRVVSCRNKVTVEAGRVYLVFDDKGKLTRKECRPNAPCTPSPDGRAFLSQLVVGLPGQHVGGKKMDEDVKVPLGLPSGRIYSTARAATFDLSAAGGGQWSLTLTQVGTRTPLVQQSGSDRVFTVPPGRLQRGGKYEWTVVTSRGRYTSGFDVLATADAAEVERDLSEKGINGTGVTPEQKLDELLVLFDHGLDYEAKLLARELHL